MNNVNYNNIRLGLHIGLPKTGTTSIQRLCFSQHSQINYFGQTNVWDSPDAKSILKKLMLPDEHTLPDKEVKSIITTALQTRPAVVISDEALSFGTFMLRAGIWPIIDNHEQIAEKAKSLLGQAHILIVLRNQADWFESWHRQGLKTGKYTESDFDRWLEKDIGDRADKLFSLINYESLYHAYANVFGPELVHIRLYEKYQNNLGQLASEFTELLGLEPSEAYRLMSGDPESVTGTHYAGLPFSLQRLIRQKNIHKIIEKLPKFARRLLRKTIEINKPYQTMTEEQKGSIKKHFEQTNISLFQTININADGLGYY